MIQAVRSVFRPAIVQHENVVALSNQDLRRLIHELRVIESRLSNPSTFQIALAHFGASPDFKGKVFLSKSFVREYVEQSELVDAIRYRGQQASMFASRVVMNPSTAKVNETARKALEEAGFKIDTDAAGRLSAAWTSFIEGQRFVLSFDHRIEARRL